MVKKIPVKYALQPGRISLSKFQLMQCMFTMTHYLPIKWNKSRTFSFWISYLVTIYTNESEILILLKKGHQCTKKFETMLQNMQIPFAFFSFFISYFYFIVDTSSVVEDTLFYFWIYRLTLIYVEIFIFYFYT